MVYRGCYDWYKNLGFNYIQIGKTLHVLELWYDESQTSSDWMSFLGLDKPRATHPSLPNLPIRDLLIDDCGFPVYHRIPHFKSSKPSCLTV